MDRIRHHIDSLAIVVALVEAEAIDSVPICPVAGTPRASLTTHDGQLRMLCQTTSTTEDLTRRVRVTVLHEVGHHFGMGEPRLRELGWS